MAKLDPKTALNKIDEYLAELAKLEDLDYKTGSRDKELLNKKIQSLIQIAFDDGKEKLKDYNGDVNFFFAVIGGREETDEEKQSDYSSRLESIKKFLLTYREELQLLSGAEESPSQESPRIKKLKQLIVKIQELRKLRWKDPANTVWIEEVLRFLKREFGEESDYYKDFYRATNGGVGIVTSSMTEADFQEEHIERLEKYEKHLSSFLAEIHEEESQKELNAAKANYDTKKVFIVHGHDELNLLRLEKLLRDKWHLEVLVLKDRPGKGRTIIEKFEQEAKDIGYAFVFLTAEDKITVSEDQTYSQARPNALFELGWFYGHQGRDRVCILFKKGGKIHSDLEGINRIDFQDNIEDKIKDIENELKAAGII